PRIARLIKDMQIALRDGIGIKQRVRLVWRLDPARTADASIDPKIGDLNPLRCQFASHALCQAAQRELAHREGRRLCIAFHTGGRAGKEDRTLLARQHPSDRRLSYEETPE